VTVSNDTALGTQNGGTIVNNDASLQLDGGRVILNEALTLNSSNALALAARNGSNAWVGAITLSRPSAINVILANAILHLPATVNGPGGLTNLGPGLLQFWGTAANTYAGLTTVAEGTLEARRAAQISIPGHAVIGTDSTNVNTARLQIQRDQQFV